MNLNGGLPAAAPSSSQLASPKLCNLPSSIPLIPTQIEKNLNKNESVTVTHFSDLHGGVVEKISVPVTTSSSIEIVRTSPKMTRTNIINNNNPFADEIATTKTIITSSTTPTVKISTNPFHSSFNANDSNSSDKSVKISFSILGAKNPFSDSDIAEMEMTTNGNGEKNNNRKSNNGGSFDDVDNEQNLSSISSINLKIDNNNDSNVTTIKMENLDKQTNGSIFSKKVK